MNSLKRTRSEYFTHYNVCYGEVEFKKPQALPRETPVLNTSHLVEMIVREKMRDGGYQANPFLPYMKCVGADPWLGDRRFLQHAAALFLQYVGKLGIEGSDDIEWAFESSGFKGGMFSKIRFTGPLSPINDWLQITEERLKDGGRFQHYRKYSFTFRVVNVGDNAADTT